MSIICGLNKGYGFREVDDGRVEITTDPKDPKLVTSLSPRVIVYSDDDDKTNISNVRVEFSMKKFVVKYFNVFPDGTLSIKCKRVKFVGPEKLWTELKFS